MKQLSFIILILALSSCKTFNLPLGNKGKNEEVFVCTDDFKHHFVTINYEKAGENMYFSGACIGLSKQFFKDSMTISIDSMVCDEGDFSLAKTLKHGEAIQKAYLFKSTPIEQDSIVRYALKETRIDLHNNSADITSRKDTVARPEVEAMGTFFEKIDNDSIPAVIQELIATYSRN